MLVAPLGTEIHEVVWDDKNMCAVGRVVYDKKNFLVWVLQTTADTSATLQSKIDACAVAHSAWTGYTTTLGYQLCQSTLLPFTTDKGKYIIKCDMCDATGLIRWTIQTREDISQSEFNTLVAQAYAGATATKPEATMKAAVTALRALL